jgi:hypothetical protein
MSYLSLLPHSRQAMEDSLQEPAFSWNSYRTVSWLLDIMRNAEAKPMATALS